MTAVVRIPISPSPNYLNRSVLLRSSLDRVGGPTAAMPLEVYVSPDRPAPPPEWRAHIEQLGIEWIDVDPEAFALHSYAAATHLRMRRPTEAHVVVLADADLVITGPIDDAVTESERSSLVLGVTAYRTPFTATSYELREGSGRRDCWADMFARLGLPAPTFSSTHPSAYETEWEDDASQCPPYFNFGMVFVPSTLSASLAASHVEEVQLVRSVFDGMHDAQLALSCALARLDIGSSELPIRFNFPNQPPYLVHYPDDAADIRVLHYMSRSDFDKERDLDSLEDIDRWLAGIRADPLHERVATELRSAHPILAACPWNSR